MSIEQFKDNSHKVPVDLSGSAGNGDDDYGSDIIDTSFFGTIKKWVDDCDFGPLAKDNRPDYFQFPQILIYIALHSANFYMALYVLLILDGGTAFTSLNFWVGQWMLFTEMITWGVQFDWIISYVGILTAMLHYNVEFLAALFTIEKLNMGERPSVLLLFATAAFVSQTQCLLSLPNRARAIAITVICGDIMHYIGMILLLVATFTNDNYDALWLFGAFFVHHLYDLMNYPGSPIKIYPQNLVVVHTTVSIALAFYFCTWVNDKN
jgi:hypothetical protein